MRKKRITIKEVAKEAGVAHSTVSRAINDMAVSPDTKSKILRIAKKLGYQPNLIARGLIKNKTQALALITPELNSYVLTILQGIEDVCKRSNYALMLFATEPWQDEGLSYSWVIKNWLVDGVLILNIRHQKDISERIKKLQGEGAPFVFINKYLTKENINAVGIDNYDGVFKALSHLVNLGHKKIGIINGNLMSVDGFDRYEAYKEALKGFNLSYDENMVGFGDFNEIDGYEEMKKILCFPTRPTAMFCANDLMAIGAMRAIKEKGLKVPSDIAIVGFDDAEVASLVEPPLTTVRPPLEDIGGRAVELIVDVIKNPQRPKEEIILKTKLIVRKSCGA